MDRLWCILHDKVGLLVLQLPKVIDGQDIWVMHTRNALRLPKEVSLRLLIKLIQAQHLQG